jgi:clan AA aspartic protease (TIGR02281 family)
MAKPLVLLGFLSLVLAATCLSGEVSAQSPCRVVDPTGTPLNVRTSPNGNAVGTLGNGAQVIVLDRASRGGKDWVYVGRAEDRVPIGWVFRDYLDCQTEAKTNTTASMSAQASPYVVDGLALGTRFQSDNPAYQRYQCGPSGKIPEFTWCHEEHGTKQKREEITRSHSILEDQSGTAWYVNSYVEPAFFGPNDVQNEITRLSEKFGQQARLIRLPRREGLPNAVMALWGGIELEPLSSDEVSTVAADGRVAGLSVSFLGDLQRSAKAGVPVYRIAGRAGFLWVATFDQTGRGVLRFLAADASKYSPPTVSTNNPSPPISLPPNPLPSTTSSSNDSSQTIVELKNDSGAFVVPVEINGAITLDFIVDSGASVVSVPADVVSTLIRTGTIQDSDFIGTQTYVLADGSEAPSDVFNIRSLKVGNQIIQNVRGAISSSKGALLLGQSFLQKFKSWSVDNTKHVLVLK